MQNGEGIVRNSKDTIVAVALKVFGRLGVYKTTMNDIARAAKKGRRTIYQYFKSKEEVYEAIKLNNKEAAGNLTEIVPNGIDKIKLNKIKK